MTVRTETGLRMESLRLTQRRLHVATTVGDLLARAAAQAPAFCGFERALILSVENGRLSADGTHQVADEPSDVLRLRALRHRLAITPNSSEGELIRRTESVSPTCRRLPSLIAERLDLRHVAMAPVVPEARVVALVVVDREAPEAKPAEQAAVELFAHLLGLALERLMLRTRLDEIASEVRHMTASAHALLQEAMSSPITVGESLARATVFPVVQPASPAAAEDLLSERERAMVALMAQGRSNRDIAAELHLANDTVKNSVGRILRKLNAANRAEAVARYLTGGVPA